MKVNFSCRRFRKLSQDRDQRDLNGAEQAFLDRHVTTCQECMAYEESSSTSLNLLRAASLEPQISSGFDDRVLRLVRVQTKRESLAYWSPAAVGAGIACVALFAALQIAVMQPQLKSATLPDGEVKRNINADQPFPNLELKEKPKLLQ